MKLRPVARACLIGGAMTLGLTAGTWAHEGHEDASPDAAAGMKVGIDPVTRQLRPLTPAESKALDTAAAAKSSTGLMRAAPASRILAVRPNGARGVVLGAEHLSHARVARQPDGRLVMDCVDAHELDTPVSAATTKGAQDE